MDRRLAKLYGGKITAFFAAPAATPMIYKGFLPVGFMSTVEHGELSERAARRLLEAVEKLATAAGVKVKSLHVTDDFPASAILAVAKREKCDLIYLASHGTSGFRDSLLGSQTHKVLAQSPVSVLVHR